MALTEKEYNKRWNAGARTIKELDPNFYNWYTSEYRFIRFSTITLCASFLLLAATAIIVRLISLGIKYDM